MHNRKIYCNVSKLHRLTYYCQAWHLSLKGAPLINESFQAGVFGPTSKDIINMFPNKILYSPVEINDMQSNSATDSICKEQQSFIPFFIVFRLIF